VEDIEVGVLNPSAVEIGGRERPSMEGGRVLASALAPNTDEVSVLVDTPITDVLSSLRLPFLIEEDDGVEVGLSTIVPYPPFTRVVGVLEVAGKWGSNANRLRGGCGLSDGRLVLGEADRFVTVDAIVGHIWLVEVKNTRYKE